MAGVASFNEEVYSETDLWLRIDMFNRACAALTREENAKTCQLLRSTEQCLNQFWNEMDRMEMVT